MITIPEIVGTDDGQQWEFTLRLPRSVKEAVQTFGERETLILIKTALKGKQKGLAREMFRKGASREEVDAAVAEYRPGKGKRSVKAMALDLVLEKKALLEQSPELMEQVQKAFIANRFAKVCALLED